MTIAVCYEYKCTILLLAVQYEDATYQDIQRLGQQVIVTVG